MRIIDGKHVVLFGPEWTQQDLIDLVAVKDCILKRHDATGAIEIVKRPEHPRVVALKAKPRAKVIDLCAHREEVSQPEGNLAFLKGLEFFPFSDYEPTDPGAA